MTTQATRSPVPTPAPPTKLHPVLDLAERLIAVLQAETETLEAGTYDRIAAFAERKRHAVEALARLRDAETPMPPNLAAPLRLAADQIERLTERNARALERAILVQGRVIDLFSQAAAECGAQPGYAGNGSRVARGPQPPMTLFARA